MLHSFIYFLQLVDISCDLVEVRQTLCWVQMGPGFREQVAVSLGFAGAAHLDREAGSRVS